MCRGMVCLLKPWGGDSLTPAPLCAPAGSLRGSALIGTGSGASKSVPLRPGGKGGCSCELGILVWHQLAPLSLWERGWG
ncbi:hypothetical protein Pres01_48030 [Metapseudomonas resinovorans]|nr:hypothetical protein Pres01_48030 [Pseudomonas resinovorans]